MTRSDKNSLSPAQKQARFISGTLLLAIFPIAWILYFINPHIPSSISICFFKTITGHPCPFCGLTRSFAFAVHGHIEKAFATHPLWWLAAAVILSLSIILLFEAFNGQRRVDLKVFNKRFVFPVIVFFFLYYLLKLLLK